MRAGFAADAALSDDVLLAKVSGMTPAAFGEFLYPAQLVTATLASSLVPSVGTMMN
jgi:hypothetical protein